MAEIRPLRSKRNRYESHGAFNPLNKIERKVYIFQKVPPNSDPLELQNQSRLSLDLITLPFLLLVHQIPGLELPFDQFLILSSMADPADTSKDAHVVEIPVDGDNEKRLSLAVNPIAAIQHHPLMEISESPGHLLLLKLWRREENLFARRATLRETRMDSIKREIFELCCSFFVFHFLFLTLLFASSINEGRDLNCRDWWVPTVLSVSTSMVIVGLVQAKVWRYWKVQGQLQREKGDNRALTRCIQELRMKGSSFDLSKEPALRKRMKSSSVEIKWKPLTWCSQNLVTICLLCFTALVSPASKLVLCGL